MAQQNHQIADGGADFIVLSDESDEDSLDIDELSSDDSD